MELTYKSSISQIHACLQYCKFGHGKTFGMFTFRRYLRLGNDESSDDDTPAPDQATESRESDIQTTITPRTRAVIELISMQRAMEFRPPPTHGTDNNESGMESEFADAYEESAEDENPSSSALAAVRLCVWSFFLFGFLILFQTQQNSMNAQRLQQSNRLRMPQLIHMQIPWTDYSGLLQGTSSLNAQFIDSNKTTYSVSRLNSGEVCLTAKQEIGDFVKLEATQGSLPAAVGTFNVIGLHPLSNGQFATINKSPSGSYQLSTPVSQFTIPLTDAIMFSWYRPAEARLFTISRPSSWNTDCLLSFTTLNQTLTCESSTPIFRSNAYFMDEMSGNLVSVGTDDVTVDGSGHGIHGIFVRSIKPSDGTVDFSISLPFLHRYDDGLWVFQNNPLSQGFVVLLPTIGYPPTPMQHVVAIRQGTAEYPKGTVFRLENPEMNMFRKVDTIPFNPVWTPSGCSCS